LPIITIKKKVITAYFAGVIFFLSFHRLTWPLISGVA